MAEYGSLWAGPHADHRRYRVDLTKDGLVSAGGGGEGLVYPAVRTVDDSERVFALKMLTSLSLPDYERVSERASVVAELHHPYLLRQVETFVGCALVDADVVPDEDFSVIYSVAEWLEGEPLAVAVRRQGPTQGLKWIGQIARAVDYLHSYRGPGAPDGVIHRDIKPSNVRVTSDGDAVLIDFGIARPHVADDLSTDTGTYLWRAPEAGGGLGKPGPLSDVWGVGALAYWVVVDDPPRAEGPVTRERLLHTARDHDLPDPPSLSRHIAALLEADPGRRPANLARWADQLDAILDGSHRQFAGRRLTLTAMVGGLSLLAAGTWAGLSLFHSSPRTTVPSVMLQTETPESSPGGSTSGELPVSRNSPVTMKCWTAGPDVDQGQKWFYVSADRFPYSTGYVPANSVGRQTAVPLCPPWNSATTLPTGSR